MPDGQERLINASDEDWQALSELAELCRAVAREWQAHSVRTQWDIQPTSPFSYELGRLSHQPSPNNDYEWSKSDLEPAPGSAFSYLAVARIHLQSVAVLLENGAVMFSLGPLIRSIVEHCARVAWALDPTIETRDRLARCFWIRHDDLRQARRLAKAVDSQKDLKTYTEILKDLRRNQLPRMFYPSEIAYDEKSTGDIKDIASLRGQVLPGFSALVGYLSSIYDGWTWSPGPIYDFLSAHTHPTIHVVRARMKDYTPEGQDGDESISMVRLEMKDLTEPRELTYLATFCFVQMWRLAAAYYGLDQNDPPIARLTERIDRLLDA
jgi:hypothetical protein